MLFILVHQKRYGLLQERELARFAQSEQCHGESPAFIIEGVEWNGYSTNAQDFSDSLLNIPMTLLAVGLLALTRGLISHETQRI